MLRSRSVRPRHAVACSGLPSALSRLRRYSTPTEPHAEPTNSHPRRATGRDNLFTRRMANCFTASAFSDFAILCRSRRTISPSSHSPESDQHKRTTESSVSSVSTWRLSTTLLSTVYSSRMVTRQTWASGPPKVGGRAGTRSPCIRRLRRQFWPPARLPVAGPPVSFRSSQI